jgi:hypothetical protein
MVRVRSRVRVKSEVRVRVRVSVKLTLSWFCRRNLRAFVLRPNLQPFIYILHVHAPATAETE